VDTEQLRQAFIRTANALEAASPLPRKIVVNNINQHAIHADNKPSRSSRAAASFTFSVTIARHSRRSGTTPPPAFCHIRRTVRLRGREQAERAPPPPSATWYDTSRFSSLNLERYASTAVLAVAATNQNGQSKSQNDLCPSHHSNCLTRKYAFAPLCSS